MHLFGVCYSDYLKKGNRELLTDYARDFIEHGMKSRATDFVSPIRPALLAQ